MGDAQGVSTKDEAISLAPADEVTLEPTSSSLIFFLLESLMRAQQEVSLEDEVSLHQEP